MVIACSGLRTDVERHPRVLPFPSQLPIALILPMERVKQLAAHFTGSSSGLSSLQSKHPDDVVITLAIRSPLCKAKKGGFKDARYAFNLLLSLSLPILS